MPLPLLLLLQAAPDDAHLLAHAAAMTRAAITCHAGDATEIVVCGRRAADRYRVPFIVHEPGDPRYVGVPEERKALLHRTTPIQYMGPFLVGGGAVGVSVHTGLGRGSGGVELRPLAP